MVQFLQMLDACCKIFHPSLFQFLENLLCFLCYLQSNYTAVRHMSARCLGMMSQVSTQEVIVFTVEKILPMLRASDNDTQRLGASEAVASILIHLPATVVVYLSQFLSIGGHWLFIQDFHWNFLFGIFFFMLCKC